MSVHQLKRPQGDNFSYLVTYDETGEGIVIDPSGMSDIIIGQVREKGIDVLYIINTHSHFDHVGGTRELAEKTGAKVVKHTSEAEPEDLGVDQGSMLTFGEMGAEILHTPGHSPDGISVLVGKDLFTGDTLFINECGRTDLPGGSSRELWDSLFNKLVKLPGEVEVYPGHDYGPKTHDSLGNQKGENYTLAPRTVEEFVEFMGSP